MSSSSWTAITSASIAMSRCARTTRSAGGFSLTRLPSNDRNRNIAGSSKWYSTVPVTVLVGSTTPDTTP